MGPTQGPIASHRQCMRPLVRKNVGRLTRTHHPNHHGSATLLSTDEICNRAAAENHWRSTKTAHEESENDKLGHARSQGGSDGENDKQSIA